MEISQTNKPVLVTGANGFIAGWCIIQLLEAGYQVRGTVRNLSSAARVRDSLRPHTSRADELELLENHLMADAGWDQAVAGCEYVLHLASPFPLDIPKDEDELIQPAVEGTKRVLAAAARHAVRRVVLTSSIVAVSSGQPDQNRTFSEQDWSKLDGEIDPYPKSKTLAELAAWEFIRGLPLKHPLELVVINPGYVLGPVLTGDPITSMALHKTLMGGGIPGITNMKLNIVDVRDVARAHLAALTTPQADGQRFICVAGGIFLPEAARLMAKHFNPRGYKIPTIVFPSWVVRIYGLFDKLVRENTSGLGENPEFDNRRIKEVLHWTSLPLEKTLIDMGESLIEHGVV
jgi:dihydroflavonol-4-reductase